VCEGLKADPSREIGPPQLRRRNHLRFVLRAIQNGVVSLQRQGGALVQAKLESCAKRTGGLDVAGKDGHQLRVDAPLPEARLRERDHVSVCKAQPAYDHSARPAEAQTVCQRQSSDEGLSTSPVPRDHGELRREMPSLRTVAVRKVSLLGTGRDPGFLRPKQSPLLQRVREPLPLDRNAQALVSSSSPRWRPSRQSQRTSERA
jgi:hypothetical protein